MKQVMSMILLFVLMTGVCGNFMAGAQEPVAPTAAPTNLSEPQLSQLREIIDSCAVIEGLKDKGLMTTVEADRQISFAIKTAEPVLGRTTTVDELETLVYGAKRAKVEAAIKQVENAPGLEVNKPVTFVQKITGMISFVNVVLATSGLLFVIALGWLFSLYILPHIVEWLEKIPVEVYEFIIYGACLLTFIVGYLWISGSGLYVALLGCFGFPMGLSLSMGLHEKYVEKHFKRPEALVQILAIICFIVYTALAIIFQSWFIGLLAILALETFLGFSVLVLPGMYCLGFRDDNAVAKGTIAAFIIVAVFTAAKIMGVNLPWIQVFSVGSFYAGTFILFLGLLISSSRWMTDDSGHYIWMQFVMICSGIAAILIGSVWSIPELCGFGGTFFYLYILEKYFEIPRLSKHWAWATLVCSLILYCFALLIKAYPAYFLTAIF